MQISDQFESPRALLKRGREQIEEAGQLIRSFFERKPYTRVIDIDRETAQEVHKVRLTANIPGAVRVAVKDASSNLRDALDHAIYAAAVCLVGGDPDNTGFPFARDAAGVQGELNGPRLKGNPPELRPLLASFEPHEGGNKLLCGLNRIRNPNTHRILVPVGSAGMAPESFMRKATITGGFKFGYSQWDAAKNEIEYLRVGLGSKYDYEVKVAFFVQFGDVPILGGMELIRTLHAIAGEVERVVEGIENETARLVRERSA